jgi:hypothetical protein
MLYLKEFLVDTTGGPQLSKNSTLRKGEGDSGPLKRNCYFERRPHLLNEMRLAGLQVKEKL